MTPHAIVIWWAAISWSHALLIALAVLIVIFVLMWILGKCMTINEPPPPRRSYPLADYSAQYREKVEWLGEDFLLAKPINRRVVR